MHHPAAPFLRERLEHGASALLRSEAIRSRQISSRAAVWWKKKREPLAFVHFFPQSHRGCHMLSVCLKVVDGFLRACGPEPNTFLRVCVKITGYKDKCSIAALMFPPLITRINPLSCGGQSYTCMCILFSMALKWPL